MYVTTLMDIESIMISEISQRKTKDQGITYMWNLKINKS